ncbi:hypothetical protein K458DRAFT_381306 [Lentithecium fluviatile CBS 122367]|uniref:Uncharacterized protein n=1 Tax=Lentithecium fluviatile CBS 122367 TaxID=1168545 RepID=A0A6G1JMJ8_9PLEO|nr:hypothetical protein K458DRAFT_381306 [Lentithecium fluviatile CBS 122367]
MLRAGQQLDWGGRRLSGGLPPGLGAAAAAAKGAEAQVLGRGGGHAGGMEIVGRYCLYRYGQHGVVLMRAQSSEQIQHWQKAETLLRQHQGQERSRPLTARLTRATRPPSPPARADRQLGRPHEAGAAYSPNCFCCGPPRALPIPASSPPIHSRACDGSYMHMVMAQSVHWESVYIAEEQEESDVEESVDYAEEQAWNGQPEEHGIDGILGLLGK